MKSKILLVVLIATVVATACEKSKEVEGCVNNSIFDLVADEPSSDTNSTDNFDQSLVVTLS